MTHTHRLRYSMTVSTLLVLVFASFLTTNGRAQVAEAIKVTDCTNSAWRTDINVESNLFVEGSGGEADGSIQDAIHFQDAIGDIGYNTIGSTTSHATKYQCGIWNESSSGTPNNNSNTLICGNTIVGLSHTGASGLSTDWYTGYAKLNSIQYCATGHTSAVHDNGHIIASSYTNNSGPALSTSSSSQMDLAGVHHPHPDESYDVAAYNVFNSNNSGGAQISLGGSSIIYLGLAPAPQSWPTSAYGKNNIQGSPDICGWSGLHLYDVSNNYWGGGAYSFCTGTDGTGGYLSSDPGSSGFVCSGGLLPLLKGAVPQSITEFADSDCGTLHSQGYLLMSAGYGKKAYDTLQMFIENCPFYTDSWRAFSDINGAISEWSAGGIGRWPNYLLFLKKVLYLNADTMWYCADVMDMFTALQGSGSPQSDAAAQEAVAKYIIENNRCPRFIDDFRQFYNGAGAGRREAWLDSLTLIYQVGQNGPRYQDWDTATQRRFTEDTTQHPYDSTFGSLEDYGLGILRGPQNAVVGPTGTSSTALVDARLLDNPTSGEIALSFEMGRTALVTMELHDILGHSIPIENSKYQLEQPGSHEASIPAMNLPPGSYYLRLTTDTGETRTLKVVKE